MKGRTLGGRGTEIRRLIVGVMKISEQRTRGLLVWIDAMDHLEVVMMMVTMTSMVLHDGMMVGGEEEMKDKDGQVEMIVVVTGMNTEITMTIGVVMTVLVISPHHSREEIL